jgi:hypothetical protein
MPFSSDSEEIHIQTQIAERDLGFMEYVIQIFSVAMIHHIS